MHFTNPSCIAFQEKTSLWSSKLLSYKLLVILSLTLKSSLTYTNTGELRLSPIISALKSHRVINESSHAVSPAEEIRLPADWSKFVNNSHFGNGSLIVFPKGHFEHDWVPNETHPDCWFIGTHWNLEFSCLSFRSPASSREPTGVVRPEKLAPPTAASYTTKKTKIHETNTFLCPEVVPQR